MNLAEALKILKYHQKWRLGKVDEMIEPKELTKALEIAISLLSKLKQPK